MHRLDDIMSDINILKQGGKSSALDKAFAESASAISSQKLGENGVGTTESLLDLDFAASAESKSSMEAKVKRVEAALEKLRKIENERKETLNDLREKASSSSSSCLFSEGGGGQLSLNHIAPARQCKTTSPTF